MLTASQSLAIARYASAQPSLAERVSRPKTRAILGLMRLNFLSVGIPKTWLGGHSLSARVVGLSADIGVGCPVRNQAKQARQGFSIWHRLITNISLPGSPNESGWVARPDIVFARVNWRHNTEVFGVAFALLDGLVMTAHGLIVAASLSP